MNEEGFARLVVRKKRTRDGAFFYYLVFVAGYTPEEAAAMAPAMEPYQVEDLAAEGARNRKANPAAWRTMTR